MEFDDYFVVNEGMLDGYYVKFGGENFFGYLMVW